MCNIRVALVLLLSTFFTTGSGFAITTPPPTPTTRRIPQRTLYGAYGPAETFFQIQPKVELDRELRAREVVTATINTCGWTSRDAYYPKTCPVGLGCGWIKGDRQSDYGVVCVPFDDAGEWNWADAQLPTVCYGYGGGNVTIISEWSQTWSSTLYCGTSAPACATAVFDGGPSFIPGVSTSYQAYTYTSMFCTNEVTRVRVYQAVTNSILPSVPPSSSSTLVSSSSTVDGGSSSKDPTSKTTSGTATPTETRKSSDPKPVGTIAGATVGGVLGIAAVAGLAGFVLWRRRDTKKYALSEISQDSRDMPNSTGYSYIPANQMAYGAHPMGYMPHTELPNHGPPPIGRAM